MARTFTCNEEIIVVSKGTEDIGKLAMLGNGGKFDPSVIPDIQASIPAGVVLHFAAATPPKGWLKADGSAISRNEYEDLFAIVGTTFGIGDGNTTFNLPDLRGEFIRGFDDGAGNDVDRNLGSKQPDDFKGHIHGLLLPSDNVQGGNLDVVAPYPRKADAVVYAGQGNAGTYMSVVGGSETRPRNVALLACIKY